MPSKLRLGKAEPAFEKPKILQQGISQKRLNELAEDWDAMYAALMPFAQRYDQIENAPLGMPVRVNLQADLKKAKEVLELVCERLEKRRIAQAERQMAGRGDICRLCASVIEGSEPHELEGYCSKTCQREDGNSEWPSPEEGSLTSLQPDPMFEVKDKP